MRAAISAVFLLGGAACAPRPPPTAAAPPPPPPPAVSAFQVRAAAPLAEALKFGFEPLAPIGPGFYARVYADGVSGDAVVYLGPDPDRGRWSFGSDPPESVLRAARLVALTAVVRIDTTGELVHGDATLVVETGGTRLLPVQLDAPPESLRVETDAGVACPVKVLPRRALAVVELPSAAPRAVLRLRWQARPPQIDQCHVRRDSVLLPGAYPWLPTLPATDADFDVAILYPRRFDLLPGGKTGRVSRASDGWRRVRTRFHAAEPVTVVGRRSWVRHPFDLDGVPVLIALDPRDIGRLPEVERSVRRAYRALRPLGPLPGRLQVAWCPQPNYQGIASRGFIGIDDFDPHVIAHEMAHQYFHAVDDAPPPLKAWELLPESREWSGDWTEAVAEYLATWAKDDAEARAHRLGWSFRYAHVPDERPLREIRDKGLPADDPRHVVVYTKGPLLLAEMERRIGRERMAGALAGFVSKHQGRRADWADLAGAFGEEGAWLKRWLALPGAPELVASGLVVRDGFVEGVLRSSDERFEGVLEIGVITAADAATLRMDEAPRAVHAVTFSGAETPLRLPISEGATGLLLDPNHRLPRRWSGLDGLFVPLPAPPRASPR